VATAPRRPWFHVASDPARPFVVEAAGGTTTALGTSFDIAINPGGAQISVTEHEVAIAAAGGTAIVAEGQQLSYGPDLPTLVAHSADVEDEAAWRRGYLIFHDKPLGDVLAAIERHFHGRVLVMTPVDPRPQGQRPVPSVRAAGGLSACGQFPDFHRAASVSAPIRSRSSLATRLDHVQERL
jgi:ferric-dicitrate binding protein FerR (iron transport regulator)